MRPMHLFVLLSLFSIQTAFADDAMMSSDTKPCGDIAKTCLNAGFSRNNNGSKRFWKDCMKPIILGQTVNGVNVDSATVNSCRTDKINELKQELNDFENVSTK